MGYETHRFDENVEDFLCPICFNVLETPIEITTCEHMFCYECLFKWFCQSPSCPVDRKMLHVSNLRTTSRFFRMLYNRMKIRCTFVESGCVEIVQIEHIKNHEKNCQYNPSRDVDRSDTVATTNICYSQKDLVEQLKENGRIQSIQVENVMLAVDRSLFCSSNPYEDTAKKINYGATISAPHIHGIILELLRSNLTDGAKVLDIGSGSGYLTVCMALMTGNNGRTIATHRIKFLHGEGRCGYLHEGPYDAINIGGAIKEVPRTIINQLKPNGKIVVPLICSDGSGQKLVSIHKSHDGAIETVEHMSIRFARLTDLTSQLI